MDAARDAVVVRGDSYALRKIDGEMPSVAATDVEHIVVQERVHHLDHPQDTPVPLLLSVPVQRVIADIVVVGASVVERMLRELEMGRQPSAREHSAADAGP